MDEMIAWQMTEIGAPMQRVRMAKPALSPGEVVVRVAGCGVCHTDLGFYYDGVRTIKPLPLTLGHEISGIVEDTGASAEAWRGKAVVIPAVMPCGECDLCRKGRGTICRNQCMPGNHIHGGFASHIVVPQRYLCEVEVSAEDAAFGKSGVTLKELSVVADAVTTPFQAVKNSGLDAGDLAIFVGVGGIGGFGVQIANALGATVIAIDIDARKLQKAEKFGAAATFDATQFDSKGLRNAVREFAKSNKLSLFEWKIFETSGSKPGQETAFGLLTFGATLSVVGFTMAKLELRLSNLMAFDARAIGNWGCHPKFYPEVLDLVGKGAIQLGPFVQTFSLSEINTVFERVHNHEIEHRPILVPDHA